MRIAGGSINDSLVHQPCVYAAQRWRCAHATLQFILFFFNWFVVRRLVMNGCFIPCQVLAVAFLSIIAQFISRRGYMIAD